MIVATPHRVLAADLVRGNRDVHPFERLLQSREKHAHALPWADLESGLLAWDVQAEHVRVCRRRAAELLVDAGCPPETATHLARRWIRTGDYLLIPQQGRCADLVVGNPPYIRIEDLPAQLLRDYRTACPTMGGRADVYIGFFERSLDLLKPGGKLGFICADRWMRNQYGKHLREKIATGGFAMDATLVMHDTPAFLEEVSAYPAITLLRRGRQESAVLASATDEFDDAAAVPFVIGSPTTASPPCGLGRSPAPACRSGTRQVIPGPRGHLPCSPGWNN